MPGTQCMDPGRPRDDRSQLVEGDRGMHFRGPIRIVPGPIHLLGHCRSPFSSPNWRCAHRLMEFGKKEEPAVAVAVAGVVLTGEQGGLGTVRSMRDGERRTRLAGFGMDGNCSCRLVPVSYTHLRAHETDSYLVCRLL